MSQPFRRLSLPPPLTEPSPTLESPRDRAFAAAMQAEIPRVRAFVTRLCRDPSDRDDVVQECLHRAWRYRDRFDPQRALTPWLLRTAFRTACDHRKRKSSSLAQLAEDPAGSAPCSAELRDEIEHALKALSDLEREFLLGFHRDGLSLAALATRSGLPLNTVKSHLHRARSRLRPSTQPASLQPRPDPSSDE